MHVIEEERRARGIGQAQLAEAVGVSQSQVSRILAGKRPATLNELLALCEAVGLPLSETARRAGETGFVYEVLSDPALNLRAVADETDLDTELSAQEESP
ncbi:hypothetical protein GCM10028802_33280 [Terrabacter terrigena]